MFHALTVRARVMAGFAVVLVLLVAIAAHGAVRAYMSGKETDYLLHDKLRIERMIGELGSIIHVNVAQLTAAAKTDDARYEAAMVAEGSRREARAQAIIDDLDGAIVDSRARQLLAALIRQRADYLRAREGLLALKASAGRAAVDDYIGRIFGKEAGEYQAEVDRLAARQQQLIDERRDATHAANALAIRLNVGLTVLATLVGAGAAVLVGRSIVRQLGGEPATAAAVAQRIAAGDLGVDVDVAAGDTASVLHAMKAMR